MSDDDHTGQDGLEHDLPESLLPYDDWVEDAYREVMLRAIEHVAAEGLPGAHHFYLTFRTNRPDVIIPSRLRAQYPEEMTIVLQHQFWDLAVPTRPSPRLLPRPSATLMKRLPHDPSSPAGNSTTSVGLC